MPRLLTVLLFLGIVCGITAAIHYYLWARLVRDAGLPAPWRTAATASLIALAALTPAGLVAGRLLRPAWGRVLAWPSTIWMGTMFILFVLLVAADAAQALAKLARHLAAAPPDPERRRLLGRLVAAGSALAGAGLSALALRTGLASVHVRQVEVPIARLHTGHDGFVIAQLTDVHVGPTIGRAFIEELVARTNALAPDVVAITGDLVDGEVVELAEHVAPLARLRARHGVYFVTGNHEYFSGWGQWLAHLPTLGIRVLSNERITLTDGDATLELAGVEDHTAPRYGGAGPDVARALAGRNAEDPVVLLAHQPKAIGEAVAHGVDLQLSGHTHGGQIWPFRYVVALAQPFVLGLDRVGHTHIYVSPGTGYWGPPMRLGTAAEITKIVLRSSSRPHPSRPHSG